MFDTVNNTATYKIVYIALFPLRVLPWNVWVFIQEIFLSQWMHREESLQDDKQGKGQSDFYLENICLGGLWCSNWDPCGLLTSMSECPGVRPSLVPTSSFLLMCTLGVSRWWPKSLSPRHPCERSGMELLAPGFSQDQHQLLHHLGSGSVDVRFLSLPLPWSSILSIKCLCSKDNICHRVIVNTNQVKEVMAKNYTDGAWPEILWRNHKEFNISWFSHILIQVIPGFFAF